MKKEERQTMRISYTLSFGGRVYKGINVPIGDTINPDWYTEEGGKGKRYHKWSAIYHSRTALYDEIQDSIIDDINEHNPSEFGFKFTLMEKGE